MAGLCELLLQINFPFKEGGVPPIPLWLCFCFDLYFTHHMRRDSSLTAAKDTANTWQHTPHIVRTFFLSTWNARSIFSYTSYLRINYWSPISFASYDLLPLDSRELGEKI